MKRKPNSDPLLALLPASYREPTRVALAYSCISLLSTIVAASIEGLFIHEGKVEWNGSIFEIRPLCFNFSTLADFTILNPLIIMYLLRANSGRRSLSVSLPSCAKDVGRITSMLCLLTALTATALYFRGFLHGNYFDAVVAISKDGTRLITVTGWLVFAWTAIIIHFILKGVIEQAVYARSLLRLRPNDVPYDPLHLDQVGGLKELAEPALDFLKAMIVLFVALLLFAIYDLLIFHIGESHRSWAIAAYAATAFPLFILPMVHLHGLMKARRQDLLTHTLELLRERSREQSDYLWEGAKSHKEFVEQIESIRKIRDWFASTPVWPLPVNTLIRACVYMCGVVTPLVPKVMPVVLKVLGLES